MPRRNHPARRRGPAKGTSDKTAAIDFREPREKASPAPVYVLTREDADARDAARLAALVTPGARRGGTALQLAYAEARAKGAPKTAIHAVAVRFGLDDATVEGALDRAAKVDRKAGQTPITTTADAEARRVQWERKNGAPAVAQAMRRAGERHRRRAGASRAVVVKTTT